MIYCCVYWILHHDQLLHWALCTVHRYEYMSEVIIRVIYLTYWMFFRSGQVGWVSWTIKAVLWADGERHTHAKPRYHHWWSEQAAAWRSVDSSESCVNVIEKCIFLVYVALTILHMAISPFSLKRLFKVKQMTKTHKYFHARLTHGVKRTKLASQRKDESTPLS